MKWSEKRVLVTGGAGFIGSHLVEALLSKGAKVRALIHYNSRNNWGWLDRYEGAGRERLEIFAGDVRDPSGVAEAMKDCHIVYHLAALIGIPFSYHSPDTYVDTNIRGTLNILQAARRLPVDKVLVTSTSEVYGTARYAPIDEKHPLQGQSPYSATKIGADRLAESFHLSFGLPVVIARPFNTYGPRQSARAIIPALITQLLAGRTEIQCGSLAPSRDFNYVTDTVAGFIALAESTDVIGQEVNIATGQEFTIRDVAERLIALINPDARLVEDAARVRPVQSEVMRLCGDNRKITALTTWRPVFNLDQGLSATIAWMRDAAHQALYKPDIYTI